MNDEIIKTCECCTPMQQASMALLDDYFEKAKKLTKGQIDPSNGFIVRADCYNVAISDLKRFRHRKTT